MTERQGVAATEAPEDPGPSDSPVLRWLGDETRFHSGIPNRDATTADGLTDEQIELAIKSGTHEKD